MSGSSPEGFANSSQVRRLAALWFADIVGYSRLAAHNESAALGLVQLFQTLVRRETARHRGRVVKFTGDGAISEFVSTEAAVRAAVALRDAFATVSGVKGQRGATLRIGVHMGEVVAAPDGDLYGDGVNTAARLQTEAAPGQVVVSEEVWHQLRPRPELRFEALGERELRGVGRRMAVFAVALGRQIRARNWSSGPTCPRPLSAKRKSKRPQLAEIRGLSSTS